MAHGAVQGVVIGEGDQFAAVAVHRPRPHRGRPFFHLSWVRRMTSPPVAGIAQNFR